MGSITQRGTVLLYFTSILYGTGRKAAGHAQDRTWIGPHAGHVEDRRFSLSCVADARRSRTRCMAETSIKGKGTRNDLAGFTFLAGCHRIRLVATAGGHRHDTTLGLTSTAISAAAILFQPRRVGACVTSARFCGHDCVSRSLPRSS